MTNGALYVTDNQIVTRLVPSFLGKKVTKAEVFRMDYRTGLDHLGNLSLVYCFSIVFYIDTVLSLDL